MVAEPSTDNEKRMWGGVSSLLRFNGVRSGGAERSEPRADPRSRHHLSLSRSQGGTAVMAAEPEAANEKRMWGGVSLFARRRREVEFVEQELTLTSLVFCREEPLP